MIRLIMCENIKMGGRGLHARHTGGGAPAAARGGPARAARRGGRRRAAAAAGAGALEPYLIYLCHPPHLDPPLLLL